jgi:hypothetical protein
MGKDIIDLYSGYLCWKVLEYHRTHYYAGKQYGWLSMK